MSVNPVVVGSAGAGSSVYRRDPSATTSQRPWEPPLALTTRVVPSTGRSVRVPSTAGPPVSPGLSFVLPGSTTGPVFASTVTVSSVTRGARVATAVRIEEVAVTAVPSVAKPAALALTVSPPVTRSAAVEVRRAVQVVVVEV